MTVMRLRQWRWAPIKTYNGFTHAERVRGWQLVWWFRENGWMPSPEKCAITGRTDGLIQYHNENYYTPWKPYTLCNAAHKIIHRRFYNPESWQKFVNQHVKTGEEWFCKLSTEPDYDLAAELRTKHGDDIANVFKHAPVPDGIEPPWDRVFAE